MDSSVSHPSIVILIKRLDVMQGHFLDTSNTWRSLASTWHQRNCPQNKLQTIGEHCKLYITFSDDDLSEIELAKQPGICVRFLPTTSTTTTARIPRSVLGKWQRNRKQQWRCAHDSRYYWARDKKFPTSPSQHPSRRAPGETWSAHSLQTFRHQQLQRGKHLSQSFVENQGRSCGDIKFLLGAWRTTSCRGNCRQQEKTLRAKNGRITRQNAQILGLQLLLSYQNAFTGMLHSQSGHFNLRQAEERLLCKYFGHLENCAVAANPFFWDSLPPFPIRLPQSRESHIQSQTPRHIQSQTPHWSRSTWIFCQQVL